MRLRQREWAYRQQLCTYMENAMEVEITWGRVIRVWWAYFWRNLLAIFAAVIAGAIVGGLIGFVMGAMGLNISAIQYVTASVGAFLGLSLSVMPIKMILGKDFGQFRLVLVASPQATQRGGANATPR
jgi:hypothetical protein